MDNATKRIIRDQIREHREIAKRASISADTLERLLKETPGLVSDDELAQRLWELARIHLNPSNKVMDIVVHIVHSEFKTRFKKDEGDAWTKMTVGDVRKLFNQIGSPTDPELGREWQRLPGMGRESFKLLEAIAERLM